MKSTRELRNLKDRALREIAATTKSLKESALAKGFSHFEALLILAITHRRLSESALAVLRAANPGMDIEARLDALLGAEGVEMEAYAAKRLGSQQ